jgi:hypothetical protein
MEVKSEFLHLACGLLVRSRRGIDERMEDRLWLRISCVHHWILTKWTRPNALRSLLTAAMFHWCSDFWMPMSKVQKAIIRLQYPIRLEARNLDQTGRRWRLTAQAQVTQICVDFTRDSLWKKWQYSKIFLELLQLSPNNHRFTIVGHLFVAVLWFAKQLWRARRL